MRYSIVIPAYNESARIAESLDKILQYANTRRWDIEIIVVDDGSSDSTPDIVRDRAAENPCLHLIANPGNRGKGYSVRNGMLHAQGEILLFSDADLSSPIEEFDNLLAAIAQGADVAIGSRWVNADLQTEKQPIHRQLFGRLFNLALRLTLGLKFKDTQCGFKAFTRPSAQAVFPRQTIERWGFDPELIYLAQRLGFRVVEVPVAWAHREGTRINPLRDGIRMLGEMLEIRWNALTGRYNHVAKDAFARLPSEARNQTTPSADNREAMQK
ncbi:MAG TPA: dolichyl-phosphate beta-glucosyltransferase [Terriglobales bacterium]|nr:dolichyl-phosphate beta-glucosyltransferase [Terriglobales bacterium]